MLLLLIVSCSPLPIPGLTTTPVAAPPPAAPVVPVMSTAPAPPTEPPPTEPVATSPTATSPTATGPAAGAPVTPAMLTPETLYNACRQRVEEPQTAGECGIASDCVAAGCSNEVCVSVRVAGDIATSCTTQPCFPYLDVCGCKAGVCEWSLKMPEGAMKVLPGLAPSAP